MNILKKVLITSLNIAFLTVNSATFTTTATTGTWAEGGAPGSGDAIVVNHDWSGHNSGLGYFFNTLAGGSITVNSGGYFKIWGDLTTRTSASLSIGSGGTFQVSGNFVLEATTGSVVFNGDIITSGNTNNANTITGSGTWTYGGTFVNSGTVNGVTGDLGGSPIALSTLPIELVKFNCEPSKNGILLNWITAIEINNNYFEIQKSTDGINFETIAYINGKGNSTNLNYYSYLDQNNLITSYYRLKQVDFDNRFSYSHIVSSYTPSSSFKITQINSSKDFYILTEKKDSYTIRIFNIGGQLLSEESFMGVKGMRYNFSVSEKDIFIIVVSNATEQLYLKSISLN